MGTYGVKLSSARRAAVAAYAKATGMEFGAALDYIIKVGVGEDGLGGRLGALVTYNNRIKAEAKDQARRARARLIERRAKAALAGSRPHLRVAA